MTDHAASETTASDAIEVIAEPQAIPRHLTAMSRWDLSRPVSLALADDIIRPGRTVFDFGSGRGGDLQRLAALGYDVAGWDPAHKPESRLIEADVVNMGYIINVIEDVEERADALRSAWNLTREVLVVAARTDWELRTVGGREQGDGIITQRGTFQKFYRQDELRDWINDALGVSSVAAAPGIYYVFRKDAEAQGHLARRVRGAVRKQTSSNVANALYLRHRAPLEDLATFISSRGRLPDATELPESIAELDEAFGSIKSAAALLRRLGGRDDWDSSLSAAKERTASDVLVFLALAVLRGRPAVSELAPSMVFDIRASFGTYKNAVREADRLLEQITVPSSLTRACASSAVGKLTADSLYVHTSALHLLSPMLRVYEGMARTGE